ncbi:hypothetical protein DSUL_60251 [Desulfovibrionales bacterium]
MYKQSIKKNNDSYWWCTRQIIINLVQGTKFPNTTLTNPRSNNSRVAA